MATARRRMPTRRGDNPSQALIIFLVFFIILSIGLGAGTYFGFAGQAKYFEDAKKANSKADQADKERDDYRFRYREALAMTVGAVGQDEELRAGDREEFVKEGGKFAGVDKTKFQEAMKKAEGDLGFDANSKKYRDSYHGKVAKLNAEVARLQGENRDLQKAKQTAETQFNKLRDSFTAQFNNLKKDITAGHATALKEFQKQSSEVLKLAAELEAKNKELTDTREAADKEALKFKAMIAKLREEKGGGAPGAEEKTPARPGEIHALVLDVSRGTTLWDKPRGKILRLDGTGRRPYLNIGSAQGVKSGLTFNVFAAGPDGKAKGILKGTLEVIGVQTNTSQAQITSLYDAEGKEIPLNDTGRSQLFRETDNPLREGDLLFNLIWKEHVAVAGPVGLAPGSEESPAEQMRDLQRFIHGLESKGVIVDAYVNLLDGKVVGAVTPDTGYLVQGYLPVSKEEREGKDERAKAVRAGMEELRKQGLDQGLFVISPENLAVVAGARQLRANLRSEVQAVFVPRQPEGRAVTPQNVQAPQRPEPAVPRPIQ